MVQLKYTCIMAKKKQKQEPQLPKFSAGDNIFTSNFNELAPPYPSIASYLRAAGIRATDTYGSYAPDLASIAKQMAHEEGYMEGIEEALETFLLFLSRGGVDIQDLKIRQAVARTLKEKGHIVAIPKR
jgi:hypothetical protein